MAGFNGEQQLYSATVYVIMIMFLWCIFGVNESYFALLTVTIFPQVFNWYHDGPHLSSRPPRANDTHPGDGSPYAGFWSSFPRLSVAFYLSLHDALFIHQYYNSVWFWKLVLMLWWITEKWLIYYQWLNIILRKYVKSKTQKNQR